MGALINSGIGYYESTSKGVRSSFDLTYKGTPIFERYFNGQSSIVVDLANDRIAIPNHNFVSGEEIIYDYNYDFLHSPIGIATTSIAGIGTTDILPSKIYAIREDNLYIKFAKSPDEATIDTPIPIKLRSVGIGTLHRVYSKNQDSRVLITVDNIIQTPIVGTGVTTSIGSTASLITDIIDFTNTSSFYNGDLIKINNELMRIETVGYTTSNYVLVKRSFMGTELGIHSIGSVIEKISGNYTISGNTINFASAPFGLRPVGVGTTIGAPISDSDYSGINTSSKFSGRCFVRSAIPGDSNPAYYDNYVFDDISEGFTGFSTDFSLKVKGNNLSNFGLDAVMLLVRSAFQDPQVVTNVTKSGTYKLTSGISSVSLNFLGLKPFYDTDVNSSGVPIGGVISSVGSSEGFGYQKLKRASGSPTLNGNGSIVSIQIQDGGSGYRSGIQTNVYVYARTGELENETTVLVGEAVIGSTIETKGKIVDVIITNPGSGYSVNNSPEIIIEEPLNYVDIPLVYSASSNGPGIGTGAKINVVVGQNSNIIDYSITDYGYGYKTGEILTLPLGSSNGGVEGLVDYVYNVIQTSQSILGITTTYDSPTVINEGAIVYLDDTATLIIGDNQYQSIVNEFQIYIDSVYKDEFSAWSFGELEVFDSPQNLFNGTRTTFPLRIDGVAKSIIGDPTIDVQSALLVFMNGVLQVPGEGYIFDGGSTITFTEPPMGSTPGTQNTGDKCQILFYKGTKDIDVVDVDIVETIKTGDTVQLLGNIPLLQEEERIVHSIDSTNSLITNVYAGVGIVSDIRYQRPLQWCRQSEDIFIDGKEVTKDRPFYEPVITPTTNIIKTVGTATSTSIYVETAKTFFDNYREDITGDRFSSIQIVPQTPIRRAKANALISLAGIVTGFEILDGGEGYTSNPTIVISNSVGFGTTAKATAIANVSSGIVTSISIVNSGFGYTQSPYVLIEQPTRKTEKIDGVTYKGDFGVITKIVPTTIGIASTGLTFSLFVPEGSPVRDKSSTGIAITVSGLTQGDYFTIRNSYVGSGITSLDIDGNVLGVSTTFIDNVYQVYSVSYLRKEFESSTTLSGTEIFNSPAIINDGITIILDDTAQIIIDEFSSTEVTVRVAEVYPAISTLAPALFHGDYSWCKITAPRRKSPKEFIAYTQNGIVGIDTSPVVKRFKPLRFFNYIP